MDFIELGKKGNSKELRDILNHIFERNNILNDEGKRGTPICIWGTHGLGKTQIVRDYAINKGWKFSKDGITSTNHLKYGRAVKMN